MSVVTTQRTISTRQHPAEDETDPEITFKTSPRATAAVAKPSSRTTATRGEWPWLPGELKFGLRLDIGLNKPTISPTFGRGAFTLAISGRGAIALSGSGRGIMRLDDPGYTGVRRNELATPDDLNDLLAHL